MGTSCGGCEAGDCRLHVSCYLMRIEVRSLAGIGRLRNSLLGVD